MKKMVPIEKLIILVLLCFALTSAAVLSALKNEWVLVVILSFSLPFFVGLGLRAYKDFSETRC